MLATSQTSIRVFVQQLLDELVLSGKVKTAQSYRSALHVFLKFSGKKEYLLSDIDEELVSNFKKYLISEGLLPNSISFYLRSLRSIYNKSVKLGYVANAYPFGNITTSMTTSQRNAINNKMLLNLKKLDLTKKSKLAFARDMFLFSYYVCGISYYDMAMLEKTNLKNGMLRYKKRGMGKEISVKLNSQLKQIISRYSALTQGSSYLLPIYVGSVRGSSDYNSAMRVQNKRLQAISAMINIDPPLTSAVAKHTWTAQALQKGIPLKTISDSLGLQTTQITREYLLSLDSNLKNDSQD